MKFIKELKLQVPSTGRLQKKIQNSKFNINFFIRNFNNIFTKIIFQFFFEIKFLKFSVFNFNLNFLKNNSNFS